MTGRDSDTLRNRLASIVEHSADAIFAKGLDGAILTWNRGAQELYGFTADEAVGQSVKMIIPPDRLEEWSNAIKRLIAGQDVEQMETERLCKDGRIIDVSITMSPVRSSDGRTDSISVMARDTSEHHRIRRELTESRERLNAILETAVEAIITINERGEIESANSATARIFGYSIDELIGRSISILMPSPYREEHGRYLEGYLRTGERKVIGIGREIQGRRKDGSVFPIDLAVSEVEPGKLFTGMIRDISERKLSEVRLRQADRLASIGTLAAGLGHDMNNVLLPVRARLNALRASGVQGLISPEDAEHVEEIRKSVSYLQQLADGLHFLALDPDREGAGGSTNLLLWWNQAGPLISKAVRQKNIKVSASIPADLPAAAISPHSLTQAILNLVINAGDAVVLKHKQKGGEVLISAGLTEDRDSILLSVSDDGAGMTDEVKQRAFELFFTTKSRGLGTGLGLPLVRRVVENARGSVQIESEFGKGTSVILQFHVAGTHASPASPAAGSLTISDSRSAALVQHILTASGLHCSIHTAPQPPVCDLWVVDPFVVPISAVSRWRQDHPTSPIVLCGSAPPADRALWSALELFSIDDPADFFKMREVLGAALDALYHRAHHAGRSGEAKSK